MCQKHNITPILPLFTSRISSQLGCPRFFYGESIKLLQKLISQKYQLSQGLLNSTMLRVDAHLKHTDYDTSNIYIFLKPTHQKNLPNKQQPKGVESSNKTQKNRTQTDNIINVYLILPLSCAIFRSPRPQVQPRSTPQLGPWQRYPPWHFSVQWVNRG